MAHRGGDLIHDRAGFQLALLYFRIKVKCPRPLGNCLSLESTCSRTDTNPFKKEPPVHVIRIYANSTTRVNIDSWLASSEGRDDLQLEYIFLGRHFHYHENKGLSDRKRTMSSPMYDIPVRGFKRRSSTADRLTDGTTRCVYY
ncbi:hypothetical protein J6590_060313 [Homalodisca vitripennis]|nr:hypothetical protein J6590_060313 [Homalodisca vitripennis]